MITKTNRVGRQRILEVAEELFTEHGYRAVSIRDIAQACEVSNAALYYHFSNKEALYYEVLQFHADRLVDRMTLAAETTSTRRRKVEAILGEYARVTVDRRSPFFLLSREAASMEKPPSRAHIGEMIHAMLRPLEDVLSEASNQGELRLTPNDNSLAALLVGMLHGLIQHKRTEQVCEITQQDISFIVDIFWEGLENQSNYNE